MNLDPPKLSIYAGTKQTEGDDTTAGDVKFNRPTSITMTDDGKILTHGFGNVGLRVVRLRNDQDPVASTYDHAAYGRERNVFFSGSAFGFPFDARPSFTALRGESGHNLIGLPTFDELALMNDQSLADYIRSGFGGSVPRPEITCADMDALIYYIRMNSLVAQSQPVAPGNSCANDPVAPEVSEISYGWTENGFEISWNTDEETIGYIAHGVSEDLHRWSDIESAFSTEHTIYLDTLPEDGTEIFFTIFARDRNGNIVVTDSDSTVLDRTEFTQAVGAPEGILLHALAILALLVARRRRAGLV